MSQLLLVSLLMLPVVFLVLSVILSKRSVKRGKAPIKALTRQILSFVVMALICFVVPFGASAAGNGTEIAQTAATTAATSNGLGLIAAALAVGIAGIGGGIAVGPAAAAAIGATSEDPKNFGKAIIFVALGEGIALYGLLVAILILFTKV